MEPLPESVYQRPLSASRTDRFGMDSMTTLDRQWRDTLRYSIEDRASTIADDYRCATEKDPSMILARRLLCATALAGAVIFALPIIIKAPADLPSPSIPVIVPASVPLKAKPQDVKLPKPQAPPRELLRGSLP
jgi:hypothetical protein